MIRAFYANTLSLIRSYSNAWHSALFRGRLWCAFAYSLLIVDIFLPDPIVAVFMPHRSCHQSLLFLFNFTFALHFTKLIINEAICYRSIVWSSIRLLRSRVSPRYCSSAGLFYFVGINQTTNSSWLSVHHPWFSDPSQWVFVLQWHVFFECSWTSIVLNGIRTSLRSSLQIPLWFTALLEVRSASRRYFFSSRLWAHICLACMISRSGKLGPEFCSNRTIHFALPWYSRSWWILPLDPPISTQLHLAANLFSVAQKIPLPATSSSITNRQLEKIQWMQITRKNTDFFLWKNLNFRISMKKIYGLKARIFKIIFDWHFLYIKLIQLEKNQINK